MTAGRMSIASAAVICSLLLPAIPARAKQPAMTADRLEFRLPDLDGNLVTADDSRFKDKVILVDIWGTWCPPCLTQIPVYARLQETYGRDGLVVVGIAFERAEGEQKGILLEEARRERGINYLILDGGTPGQVMEKLPAITGFQGFPVEILIGRDGKVRVIRNGRGYSKRWEKKLEQEVADLLQED